MNGRLQFLRIQSCGRMMDEEGVEITYETMLSIL